MTTKRYAYLIEGIPCGAREDVTIDSGFLDASDVQEADAILDGKAADLTGYESVGYTFEEIAA